MQELLIEVRASVFAEYERASKKFGAANNSPHESYAVILEELEEAKDDIARFKDLLGVFWEAVKGNDDVEQADMLKCMLECAEHAAAEWIQVAAMCHKATKTKEVGDE